MTVRELTLRHWNHMLAVADKISSDSMCATGIYGLSDFGDREVLKVETKKGRKGKPYTLYQTPEGPVIWRVVPGGPGYLGEFKSRKATTKREGEVKHE